MPAPRRRCSTTRWTADLYFAVATQGAWRTAAGLTEYDIELDLDGDGTPEAVVYNTRVPDTDLFLAETVDLGTFDVVDQELINDFGGGLDTAKMHGDVMVLPVGLGYLADYYGSKLNALGTVRYQVTTFFAADDGIEVIDSVGASGAGFGLAINSLARPTPCPARSVSRSTTTSRGRSSRSPPTRRRWASTSRRASSCCTTSTPRAAGPRWSRSSRRPRPSCP